MTEGNLQEFAGSLTWRPLQSHIMVRGTKLFIKYDCCGMYGHKKETCREILEVEKANNTALESSQPSPGSNASQNLRLPPLLNNLLNPNLHCNSNSKKRHIPFQKISRFFFGYIKKYLDILGEWRYGK